MKIQPEMLERLALAIGPLAPSATMRERWDALWASGFPTGELYKAGLNDDNIDTALKAIAKRGNQ
jgi:hypothetical protein